MSTTGISVSNTTATLEITTMWGSKFKIVASHVIVVVGLVANSLTLLVMSSPNLKYKSYSQYLSALAVFDSLVLIGQEVDMVDEILIYLQEQSLFLNFSHHACKIFLFADAVCNLMSSWLIVAMAVERLCVVCMPFRRNIWCHKSGAVFIIFILFGVLSCTQVFRLLMVGNHNGRCTGSPEADLYVPLHIYVYQCTLLFLVPVLTVLVCNIGVLLRVFSVGRATRNKDSSSAGMSGSARRRSKTTRMLVTISFTYIITTMPILVLTITLHAHLTQHVLVQVYPWIELSQAVTNINYASNFFIYILSGKKFRIELCRIFKYYRTNSFTGSSRTREEIIMMSY